MYFKYVFQLLVFQLLHNTTNRLAGLGGGAPWKGKERGEGERS